MCDRKFFEEAEQVDEKEFQNEIDRLQEDENSNFKEIFDEWRYYS